ncbi:MAG: serine hydrolase [Actinobacteria bacterium]|nr:serine hydrolase [Actinomycetota bacterium]
MSEHSSAFASVGLFTGAPQHETFDRLYRMLPSSRLTASAAPHQFPDGDPLDLPATFRFAGAAVDTEQFLDVTDTAALLVLRDGAVVHEQYRLTGGRDVQWISWSVAKSFVSALVGIAVEHGHIRSIDDAISDYIDTEPGSAYDGVRIKDVLQMSSGARWNEDYSDPTSDIVRLGAAMGPGGSLDAFVASAAPDVAPGTVCQYNSTDTQALGALLVRATGRSITDYMQEHLYEPLGMESDGYWLLDAHGREMAFGGLNLTARDFAKLGELYRRGGEWNGCQVVPAAWAAASVVPDAPHLEWGAPVIAGESLPDGYGYQWWLISGGLDQYSAIGVYNQWVFVSPRDGVTIVKQSSTRTYGTTMGEETNYSGAHEAFLQAVAAHAAGR